MKDRMERFVLLPFSMGCVSESDIVDVMHPAKRSKLEINLKFTRAHGGEKEDEEQLLYGKESSSGGEIKSSLSLIGIPRLLKNFKNFSQFLVYKDKLEQDMQMEIGLPTDVKHVTHIGLDGCTTSILSNSCWKHHDHADEQKMTDLILSFPPVPNEDAAPLQNLTCQ